MECRFFLSFFALEFHRQHLDGFNIRTLTPALQLPSLSVNSTSKYAVFLSKCRPVCLDTTPARHLEPDMPSFLVYTCSSTRAFLYTHVSLQRATTPSPAGIQCRLFEQIQQGSRNHDDAGLNPALCKGNCRGVGIKSKFGRWDGMVRTRRKDHEKKKSPGKKKRSRSPGLGEDAMR